MGFLVVTFQDKEKEDNKKSSTEATHAEIISRVCDSLQLLEQLGTAEAAKLLDEVKSSRPNPPSFVFQSHDDPGSRTNFLFDQELPPQPSLTSPDNWAVIESQIIEEAQELDHVTAFDVSLIEPSVDTINPALLTASRSDWDCIGPGNALQSGSSSSVASIGDLSVLEAEDSPLFVSHLPLQGTSSTATPQAEDAVSLSTIAEGCSDEDPQAAGSGDIVMGLPTPPTDTPSTVVPVTKKATHCSSKSKQYKVTKAIGARQKHQQAKHFTKDRQVKDQLEFIEPETVPINSSLARNVLHGLSDPDLQSALENGKGLIRDSLSEYNSSIWQKRGFWFEDALDLSISKDSSAEEKFCKVFRHSILLRTRSSDQKLRLRISDALLYLSFESLTREKRSDIYSGRVENPDQHRAATLSVDYLLSRSYPDEWDSMDIQMKQTLRRRLHEHKRQGNRCWQMAGVLGVGALLVCGDTLAKVVKNHGKYPTPKLHAIINYVVNAHPGVVSVYREFDNLARQILLGENLTAHPTRQMIDNTICRAAATKLTHQEIEDNWQQIDPASVSQELINEFVSDYA